MNASNTPTTPAGMPEKSASTHVDLVQAINNVEALPAMPVIVQKLLALQMGSEESEKTMLLLIEQDPQISAKIIGLANSTTIAASRQVISVRGAAMLLGIARVYSVAIGIAIMSLMNKVNAKWFTMQDLWLHSFGIAFAMTGISRFMPAQSRPKSDQIFLAGMLHDIGFLALAFLDPQRSDKLHERMAAEPDRPALAIEKEMLEVSHDELGAALACHWNLPEEIIAVLRHHHAPDEADAAMGQQMARLVNVAEKLLTSFGLNEYVAPGVSDSEWEALGIDPSDADEIKTKVAEQAEHALQFIRTFT